MTTLPSGNRVSFIAGMVVLAVLALLPIYTGYTDQEFYRDVVTRLMILAIAVASLNFILGYGGMISFGHAAYIGIGAYCVGIPAYYGYYNGYLHLGLAIMVSALFALVTGSISLRTRGVYFIMITMAFTQMLFFSFVSIEEYGGDDGLVINFRSEFPGLFDLESGGNLYYLTLVILALTICILNRFVDSRFGRVIRGARSNDRRMASLGFNTYFYRLAAYVIAACFCGVAGVLLGNFTNFISPEMMGWTRSGELIFMVVLGGSGSIFGPLFGTVTFLVLEEVLSGITIYWHLIFGTILILVVLFAPGGINGFLSRLGGGRRS